MVNTYEATYRRLSMKNTCSMGYILLEDVNNITTGELFRDHTWAYNGKRWDKIPLKDGDRVRFQAREEGYNSTSDNEKIGLRHIRNITKIS